MAKKNRRHHEPKPGGRRQQKLAARAAEREALAVNARPLSGVAGECDLVAMREFVPSAVAAVEVAGAERDVHIATVLPGAIAAMVRDFGTDDRALVAMQVQTHGQDLGRDLAYALEWVRDAAPGDALTSAHPSQDTSELTELLPSSSPPKITVYKDFSWWLPDGVEVAPDMAQAVENANQVMMASERIEAEGVAAAWWVDAGTKAHIRWVRPEDEDDLFDAIARVHAAGGLHIGEGSRFAGSFRTHGLLVPVFDLETDPHAQEWAAGLQELGRRIDDALAEDSSLSTDERSSRDGLRSRQVTLR